MVLGMNRNPEKYEARALEYERRGKTKKAIKNREKAARLRLKTGTSLSQGTAYPSTTTYTSMPVQQTTTMAPMTQRTPAMYEAQALKWEQRGNWEKAQKNREKVWRLQNPQYMTGYQAPMFYNNRSFVGYNVPYQPTLLKQGGPMMGQGMGGMQMMGTGMGGAPIVHTTTMAPTIETHMHATQLQQTTRMEKITEVQPIIHREIDAPEVRVVEQHVYESVPRSGPASITRTAIVEETVRPRIIEEIQPVIHREVPQTFIEQVQQHVTEHVVLPTTQSRTVVNGGAAGGGAPFSHLSLNSNPTYSSFGRYSQFGRPQRDLALMEEKALAYERAGNQKKAMKQREKIGRIRANGGAYTSARTPASYEQKALKWEQRNNLRKAQRHREKAWRLQNPQYMDYNTHPAPSFYNNNGQFLGYNQPLPQPGQQQMPFLGQGAGLGQALGQAAGLGQPHLGQGAGLGQPHLGQGAGLGQALGQAAGLGQPHLGQGAGLGQGGLGQAGLGQALGQQAGAALGQPQGAGLGQSLYRPSQFSQFGLKQRNPEMYLNKAAQYKQRGNTRKADKLTAKANQIRANGGAYNSNRTPAIYERQAQKWEQRGNFGKAQKNREKAWRLQNPQYMQQNNFPAPSFYNNNKFSGYNVPYPLQQQQQQQPLGAHAGVRI